MGPSPNVFWECPRVEKGPRDEHIGGAKLRAGAVEETYESDSARQIAVTTTSSLSMVSCA